ncbi:MAG: M20/M25/M40 family metallo-hydrolase [Lachnospiraceae bacterium]|nr:M20/M25/M40 family metallo-hydrolase [Lachnospiraceae bacterium]
MDNNLYQKISAWFDTHQAEMVQDIMRLIRIPSISAPSSPVRPFGQACRDCMDEMLTIGREHGFQTENCDYYVGCIGTETKNWDNMIGFWNHLDVVPVGNDWDYSPFVPVQKGPFLLGRGSQDNKGPAVGILYMMQCIRELHLPMKHELRLFVGCDEERGMEDMSWYTAHYPTPALSMIADAGFPVCFGEKGILEGSFVSDQPFSSQILEFSGGNASNMIPDRATALLALTPALKNTLMSFSAKSEEKASFISAKSKGKAFFSAESEATPLPHNTDAVRIPHPDIEISAEAKGIRVTAHGIGKHSAFPEGSKNAIYTLCSFLKNITALEEADRKVLENLAWFSEEFYGRHTGILYEDDLSGKTTCAATVLEMKNQHPILHFNIRYSISSDSSRMIGQLAQAALSRNMTWTPERDSAPNYFPKEHPAVDLLTNLYCELTGTNRESYVMGGGTYARKLPNAFAYGIGGMAESTEDQQARAKIFRPGHCGSHEPDEGLNVHLLTEAMKIYTMSVIALNDCPLRLPE